MSARLALALGAWALLPPARVAAAAARGQYVDPDTPSSEMYRVDKFGRKLELVMSDEFTVDGRAFGEGDDAMWTANHNRDTTNQGLAYMRPEHVTTENGFLKITTTMDRYRGAAYSSGQVMSWNKFCMTGGQIEVRYVLPGSPGVEGLWPAIWMLGNLGRATYAASTEGFWPWSYDECTRPNGPEAAFGFSQRVSRCDAEPGHGMHPHQGRGCPEVDLLETNLAYRWQHGNATGVALNATALQTSMQLSPRVPSWFRPDDKNEPDERHPWYTPQIHGTDTSLNANFYGMWNYDSISAVHAIGDDAYDARTPQTLTFEYATGRDGYMRWSHNGALVFEITAETLRAYGSTGRRLIPAEPMYLIIGTSVSRVWSPQIPESLFPAHMLIDSVRVYQPRSAGGEFGVGCSPARFPTAEWIRAHSRDYGVPVSQSDSRVDLRQVALGCLAWLCALALLYGSSWMAPPLAFVVALSCSYCTCYTLLRPYFIEPQLVGQLIVALGAVVLGLLGGLFVEACLLVALALSLGAGALLAVLAGDGASGQLLGDRLAVERLSLLLVPLLALLVVAPGLALIVRGGAHARVVVALGASTAGGFGLALVGAIAHGCTWPRTLYSLPLFARLDTLAAERAHEEGGRLPLPSDGERECAAVSLGAWLCLCLLGLAFQLGTPCAAAAAAALRGCAARARAALRARAATRAGEADALERQGWAPLDEADGVTPLAPPPPAAGRRDAATREPAAASAHGAAAAGRGRPAAGQRAALRAALARAASEAPGSRECPRAPAHARALATDLARARSLEELLAVAGDVCAWLMYAHGFQPASALTQVEHAARLLGNRISRLAAHEAADGGAQPADADARAGVSRAVDAARFVNGELLGNYLLWCEQLRTRPRCALPLDALAPLGVDGREAAGLSALADTLLFLCVWGEAANVRHAPEALCFIFHKLAAATADGTARAPPVWADDDDDEEEEGEEVDGDDDGDVLGAAGAAGTAAAAAAQRSAAATATATATAAASERQMLAHTRFLRHVVRPLYEAAAEQLGRASGRDLPERGTKPFNYDDLNEAFWHPACLGWQVAGTGPRSVAQAVRACAKSVAERHSWMHLAHAFHRVYLTHAIVLHAITCLPAASYLPLRHNARIKALSSLLLDFPLASLSAELLDLWAASPVARAHRRVARAPASGGGGGTASGCGGGTARGCGGAFEALLAAAMLVGAKLLLVVGTLISFWHAVMLDTPFLWRVYWGSASVIAALPHALHAAHAALARAAPVGAARGERPSVATRIRWSLRALLAPAERLGVRSFAVVRGAHWRWSIVFWLALFASHCYLSNLLFVHTIVKSTFSFVFAYYDHRLTFGESLLQVGFFWVLFAPMFLVSFSVTFALFVAAVGLALHVRMRASLVATTGALHAAFGRAHERFVPAIVRLPDGPTGGGAPAVVTNGSFAPEDEEAARAAARSACAATRAFAWATAGDDARARQLLRMRADKPGARFASPASTSVPVPGASGPAGLASASMLRLSTRGAEPRAPPPPAGAPAGLAGSWPALAHGGRGHFSVEAAEAHMLTRTSSLSELAAADAPRGAPADGGGGGGGGARVAPAVFEVSMDALTASTERPSSHRTFAVFWNAIVDSMRDNDLLCDAEVCMLHFHFSGEENLLPLRPNALLVPAFQLAGTPRRVLNACAALGAEPARDAAARADSLLDVLRERCGADASANMHALAQLGGALLTALLGARHARPLARAFERLGALTLGVLEPTAVGPVVRALLQLTSLLLRLPLEAEPTAAAPQPQRTQPRDVLGIARAAPLSRPASFCEGTARAASPLARTRSPALARLGPHPPAAGAAAAGSPAAHAPAPPAPPAPPASDASDALDGLDEPPGDGFFDAPEPGERAAAGDAAAAAAERAHAELLASCGAALRAGAGVSRAAAAPGAALERPPAGIASHGGAPGGAPTAAPAPTLTIGHVHAVLEVRAVLQALLGALGALERAGGGEQPADGAREGAAAGACALQRALVEIVASNGGNGGDGGFFFDDAYAASRVHAVCSERELLVLVTKLHLALALSPRRAKPACVEARRRLKAFVNSLWMDMPSAPSIGAMQSWTVLTPIYTEAVLYSTRELLTPLSDGRALLDVLKSLYALEWSHLLERIGVHTSARSDGGAPDYHIHWADARLARQVRLWASMRGQTLTRTMVGMMQYERALALISRVECPPDEASAAEAGATIGAKFSAVVAAQLYAQFVAEGDPRADDVNWLLARFPSLRIAFVTPWPPPAAPAAGAAGSRRADGSTRALSRAGASPVLAAALARCEAESGEIVIDAEVALPGNPFLGEGKPENQNIALPFAFGEKVQVIDMNQEGYLEEALKMRSLLHEFELTPPGQPPRTIVGFTEHIFTEASGFVTAVYMALQERYFCAFHQRVADVPLDVRMHYGHPDVLDKVHFLARGGIARPSKQINLNEDIFAAYNTMLRGGSVVFREYLSVGKGRMTNLSEIFCFEVKLAQGAAEQCLSRDVFRLTRALRLTRLLSVYYSGVGFYIHQVLVMRTALLIGYLLALLTLLDLDRAVMPAEGNIGFIAALPLLVTLATIVPAGAMVLAQRGVRSSLSYAYMVLSTLAPVYYIFITQARAHFFAHTVRYGGAKYAIGARAVSTTHVPLHELFAAYARSHFYPACDLAIVLAVGRAHTADKAAFVSTTWMLCAISACWLCAPSLYNLQAVELPVLADDARALVRWFRTPARARGARAARADASWEAWWEQAHTSPTQAGWEAPAFASLAGLYYAYIALELHGAPGASMSLLALVGVLCALPALPVLAALCPSHARTHRRCAPLALFALACALLAAAALVTSPLASVGSVCGALGVLYFALGALGCALEVLLVETSVLALPPLRLMHRARDVLLSGTLLAALALLGALRLPAMLHTRMLFQAHYARPSLSCKLSYAFALVAVGGFFAYRRLVYLDIAMPAAAADSAGASHAALGADA